jgi:hypothetical protein
VTACGLVVSLGRPTSMVPAEAGRKVRALHSSDCMYKISVFLVVAWAGTERHGVQPVCISLDGTTLGLLEDMLDQCTDESLWRAQREKTLDDMAFFHGPAWDGTCGKCRSVIPMDERFFEWVFNPFSRFRLHIHCLSAFVASVGADVARAVGEEC